MIEDVRDIHAHPEKLLESSRLDEEDELVSGSDGAREIYKNFWRSASFKHLINGVAIGDVDGDRKLETVVITPHVVMIYRSEQKKFFKTHEMAQSNQKYFIGVDVADINDNGYAEIFVTSLNSLKNSASSFVLEYDGKNYQREGNSQSNPRGVRAGDCRTQSKAQPGAGPGYRAGRRGPRLSGIRGAEGENLN